MAVKSSSNPDLATQIAALSPEARKLVMDLVVLLDYQPARRVSRRAKRPSLAKERFIGMWADRADMTDSAAYVRGLRESEWNRHRP